jgi:antitoxin YefM
MDAITYSDLRQNLAAVLDRIENDHEPVMVLRRNGQKTIMMSKQDYDSMQETFLLLRHPKNAQRLLESIAQAEQGTLITKTLEELKAMEDDA